MGFNRVSLFSFTTGCIALLTKFLTYKPNRLVRGTSVYLWQIPGGLVSTFLIGGLSLIGFILLGRHNHNRKLSSSLLSGFVSGFIGNLIVILPFIVIGTISIHYVKNTTPIARVSPSIGFWLLLFTGYLYINISVKRIKNLSSSVFNRTLILATSLLSPILITILLLLGNLNDVSMVREYLAKRERFFEELVRHLYITGFSITIALAIGIPLGFVISKNKKLERVTLGIINVIQTIPSLALFGLMIAPLSFLSFRFHFIREMGITGIGAAPAIIALALYALLPITSNTYAGIKSVDPSIIDAGKGMGMGKLSLLSKVEFPLALPIIFNGIRIATVQTVGNTTVAALIGAGGLGTFIFQGLGQAVTDLILLGALPIIVLAVIIDRTMYSMGNLITPRGLKREVSQE